MNEIKVGLLALGAMAAIAYMSLKVTSNQSGFGEYETYQTLIGDASGIFPKTPIRVAGINAGRIKRIELVDNNALITFEVLKGKVKISKGSFLKVKTVGFLGDKYLEIIQSESQQFLPPMSLIPSEQGGGVEALVKDASTILKDVQVIVKSIKEGLAPDGDTNSLKNMMGNMGELVANTKDATASLKRLMENNESKIDRLVTNMESFTQSIDYQMNNQNQDSAMHDVKRILANVEDVSEDLSDIVGNVKAGKGTVGKLLVEEEIADEVTETLSGVRRLVTRVDNIRTEIEVFTGANTDYGPETMFSLKIVPGPERFYQIGLVTSEFGPTQQVYTDTYTNGELSQEVRETRQKNTFRFNVLLGRKIHNWTLKGGLIETTGGIGLGYELPHWGTSFGIDLFDYRDDDELTFGANLRPYANVQLWNVLYGRMAFEDVINDERSLTLSAGLRFNDEDLRGLIAFFL